jgi:hypothetical protein
MCDQSWRGLLREYSADGYANERERNTASVVFVTQNTAKIFRSVEIMKGVLLSSAILLVFSLITAKAGEVQSQPKLEIHKQSEERTDEAPDSIEVGPPRKGVIVDLKNHPNPLPEEREAVRAAIEAGATVEYDATNHVRRLADFDCVTDADMKLFGGLQHLEVLILKSPDVTDAGLAGLAKAKKLRIIELTDTQATDAGMRFVGQMTNLESLSLSSEHITGAGLVHLANLTRLVALNTDGSTIGDDGMRKVAELGSLRRLKIGGQVTRKGLAELERSKSLVWLQVRRDLTDDDMLAIGQLKDLEVLQAGFPNLTDEGLRRMKDMKRLRSLNLRGTKVSDAGMAYVGQMTGLERLDPNLEIGDAGIAKLNSLTNLKQLDLSDTQVTDAGLAKLIDLRELRGLGLRYTHVTAVGVAQLRGLKKLEIDLDYTDVSMADVDKLNEIGVRASRSSRTFPKWNER